MTFEYQIVKIFDGSHQIFGTFSVVFFASGIFFFNAWLNDSGHDILPCVVNS